jgi:hypothetical protein
VTLQEALDQQAAMCRLVTFPGNFLAGGNPLLLERHRLDALPLVGVEVTEAFQLSDQWRG